jgi:hypothetical protein
LPFRKLQPPQKASVFTFLPIPYNPVYVMCCYFWPDIGQLDPGLLGVRFGALAYDFLAANLSLGTWLFSSVAVARINQRPLPSEQVFVRGSGSSCRDVRPPLRALNRSAFRASVVFLSEVSECERKSIF